MNYSCYKYLLFFSLLIFFSKVSYSSQANVDSLHYSNAIEFRAHSSGQAVYTNDFLQKISEASGKMRVYTKYSYNIPVTSSVRSLENGKVKISISIDKANLSGDITYKDFSLEELLTPDVFVFKILLKNDYNQKAINFNLDVPEFNELSNYVFDTVISDFKKNSDLELKISSFEALYSKKRHDELMTYTKLLEDYYNASETLDFIHNVILDINMDNPEKLILEEFKLCDLEAKLGEIAGSDFFSVEELRNNDVKSVFDKYKLLKNEAIEIRKEFNCQIPIIDQLLYQKAKDSLNAYRHEKARVLFKKALSYNRFHIPALAELGNIDLYHGDYDAALRRVKYIMKEIYPSGEWLDLALSHAMDVYGAKLEAIADLIEKQNYTEALEELNKVKEFCDDCYPFRCDRRVLMNERKAKLGIYNSFISVSKRAYDVDNLSFSEIYAVSAMEYHHEHKKILGDYKYAENLIKDIFDSYIIKSNNAFDEGTFDKAVYFYENMERLCSNYAFLECPDNLKSNIAFSKRAFEKQQILAQEEAALDSADTEEIVSEEKMSIKDDILEVLSHGHLMAWAGKIDEAKLALNNAVNDTEKYSFKQDTLIHSRIQSLKDRLFIRECELAEDKLKSGFKKIRLLLDYDEYIIAMDSLDKIKLFISEMEICNLPYYDTIRFYEKYKAAANYQQHLKLADKAFLDTSMHSYEVFLKRYHRAENIWREHNLYDIGVIHEPLVEVIIKSSKPDLINPGIRFFADRGKLVEAVVLLSELKKRDIKARSTKEIQKYAGSKAADIYKEKFPEAKPKKIAKQITNNDNWFKYFIKAFNQNW